MKMTFARNWLFLLLLISAPLSGAAAQERRGDPHKAIESYERYLERKPYHDWAFDKLVETVVSLNQLGELVDRYRVRVEGGSQDTVDRVVLARLLARTDDMAGALEILAAIEEPDAALLRLMGSFELQQGHTAEAVAALNRAAQLTRAREDLEKIHELRGQAYLAAGDRAQAHSAFQALAELDPDDFHLRLECASTLAFHGLHAEALVEFEVAERLANDDIPRRCRVLSEIGKLHEALAQGEQALSTYRTAIGLMSRGNWLKRDLYERILSLHERSGMLEALLADCLAAIEESPRDLDAREFLSRVLLNLGRKQDARDTLVAAIEDFPGDMALSRRMIETLRGLEDHDAVIVEYQRILVERPEELELYLELGQVFASTGRFEQAKRQWTQSLDQRLTDPGLCLRLADLYAMYDQAVDAVAMYEKAIELEPGEIRYYADLALFLRGEERDAEVPALLARAEDHAAGNPGRLDELSVLWQEHGDLEHALAAIEAALDAKGDDPQLLYRRADLQVAADDVSGASETLHRVINLSRESNLRKTAVDRLMRLFYKGDRVEELIAIEEEAVQAGSLEVAPYLVLGRAWIQKRQPDKAAAYLERLLEIAPKNEGGRLSLARLYEQRNDLDLALAEYEELMRLRPQNRRKYLAAVAQIHLSRYEQDKAFACYEEILASAPDNPAAFREVANAYKQLGLLDEAVECLRQALRLDPEDGRTRLTLADLHNSLGEAERAELEILAATEDEDEDVRRDARKRYYDLLARVGRVGTVIDGLRQRIDENPYDIAAPLTLTDLYVRELEYELALEVLERLLSYQPNQPRLLRERARMLSLLERHADALVDLERLRKLPDADREKLALDIADAALEMGDSERAREVLRDVQDVHDIVRVYRAKDLWNEADETLERALSRAPADVKLLKALSRLRSEQGDEQGAIDALERALEVRGDSWRTITTLGELYHEAGRPEQALECGRRLFALVRIEDDEEEEGAGASSNRSASTNLGEWYRKRVGSIQSYFRSINQVAEFARIGAEEVLHQPSNTGLFRSVISAMRSQKDMGARCLEVLSAVRIATVGADRIPPGMTSASWDRFLASTLTSCLKSDPRFSEEHRRTLVARIESSEVGSADWIELAQTLATLGDKQELIETLTRGAAAFPDEPQLQAGLALTLKAEKRWEEALIAYDDLLVLLADQPPDEDEQILWHMRLKSGRQAVLQGFPVHVRRRVSDDDVERFLELTRSRNRGVGWGAERVLDPYSFRLDRCGCLGKAGRKDEAAEQLAALLEEPGLSFVDRARIAHVYFDLDLLEPAADLYTELRRLESELSSDALFGFNRGWASSFTAPMRSLARIHERRGEFLEAYDLLRSFGDAAAAELILTTNEGFGEAQEHYRERMAQADAALEAAPDHGPTLEAWRDAAVRLAELHMARKEWDDSLRAFELILERRPDDFDVLTVIAALHAREDRWEEAIALHERAIALKRKLSATPRRPEYPPGRVITPVVPARSEQESWAWDNLRSSMSQTNFSSGYPGSMSYNVRPHYVEILKLLLDRGEITRASQVLREVARTDLRTFGWMSWAIVDVMTSYRFGAEAVPFLRMLYNTNTSYEDIALQYGKALLDADRRDEARRVLTRLRNRSGTRSYYGGEADGLLKVMDQREGRESSEAIEALQAKILEDPKNVKKRVELVQRLFIERDVVAALEHVRVARKLAPHMEEVKALLLACLQLNGLHEEFEERRLEGLRDISDESERLAAAAQLARWRYERGDIEGVEAVFDRARSVSASNSFYYTAAGWYVEVGEFEAAARAIEEEIERAPTHRHDMMRKALSWVRALAGDPLAALDGVWEESFEGSTLAGDRSAVLPLLVAPMRRLANLDQRREVLLAECAGRTGLRGELYQAAVELACGDSAACEARLRRIAQVHGETRFLYPTIVALARARGDTASALEVLEALRAAGVGSESSMVTTSLGRLSERDALRAEIGALRLERGDQDAAMRIWSEMYDLDDEGELSAFARLLAHHGLHAEALLRQQQYLAEVGERQHEALAFLATQLQATGDHEGALAVLERTLILAKDDQDAIDEYWTLLLKCYRHLGRLDEYIETLEESARADPGDTRVRVTRLRLLAETGQKAQVLAALKEMVALPGMSAGALPKLIDLALEQGDEQQAIEWYRVLLEQGMEEWDREGHVRTLASLLLRTGETRVAMDMLLEEQGESTGLRSMATLARMLSMRADTKQNALELLLECRRLDPKEAVYLRQTISLLKELERYEEALGMVLEAFEEPALVRSMSEILADVYRSLLDHTDERQRVAEALAQGSEERTVILCAALTALQDDETAEATVHLETLLEGPADDPMVLDLLWRAYEKQEQWEAAKQTIEHLLEVMDRGQSVVGFEGWTQYEIASLRRERAELFLQGGDIPGAEAALRDRVGRRYDPVRGYDYIYGNFKVQPPDDLIIMYSNLEDWSRGLQLIEEFPPTRTSGVWNLYSEYSIRFQAGQREQVLEELWFKVYSEAAGGLGEALRRTIYRTPENLLHSTTAAGTLIKLHRENGTTGELLDRLRTTLQAESHLKQLREIYDLLLALEGEWEHLMARAEERLAQAPFDENLLLETAKVYVHLERYEEALPLLRQADRINLGEAHVIKDSFGMMVSSATSQSQTPVRFRFAGKKNVFMSTRMTSYGVSSGWGGIEGEVVRNLALCCLATGRLDEAGLFEARERAGLRRLSSISLYGPAPHSILPEMLREAELWEDAERWILEALQADIERPSHEASSQNELRRVRMLRERCYRELALMWDQAGRPERRAHYGRLLLEVISERIAEAESEHSDDPSRSGYVHADRAQVAARFLGDQEAARTDLVRFEELRGSDEPLTALPIAWAYFDAGLVTEAHRIFQAARDAGRLRLRPMDPSILLGIGLCLAAEGDPEAARPLLQRALAGRPQHERAEDARSVLK